MIEMTAHQIAAAVDARIVTGDGDVVATSVTIDSRRVAEGDCFFAIVGDRHDGHDFLDDAATAGASMLVAHRPPLPGSLPGGRALLEVADTTVALQELAAWVRLRIDPTVVAITGSLGKTTTKEIAAALLRTRYAVHATPGNLNNHWGVPLSLLGIEAHHEVMVAELAMSRPGEIRRLARLTRPDIGVITNIAPAHMENFADLEAVADAKSELAEELSTSGTLVVCADDPLTTAIANRVGPRLARSISFGRHGGADVRVAELRRIDGGWSFELRLPDGAAESVDLPLPANAAVSNFAAAAAVAWALEIPAADIRARAAALSPLPNRGEVREVGDITLLDESYNASPVAVQSALETLAGLPAGAGRRVAALGDMLEMGDWAEAAHREIGRHAADNGIALLVAVGAHAELVAAGAAQAGLAAASIHCFAEAADAGAWLADHVQPGDTVLVKGSRALGMERVVDALAVRKTAANRTREG